MRLIRCLMIAAFTAGLAVLVAEPGTAADAAPTKEQLRQIVKDLKKAGKNKEEIRLILQEKFKGVKPANLKPATVETPAPVTQTPKAVDVKPAVPAKPVAQAKPARAPQSTAAIGQLIDSHINKLLAEAKLPASPRCSDDEFLRRAFLDLTGVIPSADQARVFLDSQAPDKRAVLIEQLLASPNFGRHMADIWQAKLYPKDSTNRFVLKEPFVRWMTESFNKNLPWNEFVGQLLASTGPVEDNPAVTFVLANRAVDKLTDHVGNHFLNIQLQCAQCHNHPFVKEWKQDDYWGVAGFFSKVNADRPKNGNKGGDNTKIGVTEGASRAKAKDFFPEAAKHLPPKFFQGDVAKLSSSEPYRPALVKWMTAPENPYFAKAMVNRTWAQLFGPGFVNPVEDMHDDNTPSHPELLAALADEFGHTGYDLKNLFRSICNSEAYQRSSKPTAGNEKDGELFSHQTMKVMTPEQLYDSLAEIGAGDKGAAAAGKKGAGAAKGPPPTARSRFVEFFLAGAEEPSTTDYEVGIPQALRLMNSRNAVAGMASLRGLIGKGNTPAQVIEHLYLTTLSRRPTAEEARRLGEYLAKNGTTGESYGDILWAILNSSEFTMVR